MLAKAIEKIESLAFAKERCNVEEIEIHGQGYIHQGDSLTRIVTPDISAVQVRSLTALRSMVKSFLEHECKSAMVAQPLIITATGNDIRVYSSNDETYSRQLLFRAEPICPDPILNRFVPAEQMIINVNTCFEQTENTEKFIDCISKLYKVSRVESVDDGIGMQLRVTEGVNTNEAVTINPIVSLKPIMTYPELNQIERKFNLRVDSNGRVALMVCDEGIFERKVQDQLDRFFRLAFDKEIEKKEIVLAL